MRKPRCTPLATSHPFSHPFSQLRYVSIFPPRVNYVRFWRLLSLHMATALLIATSQRTAAWQPACQNHHQNGEAWRGEGRATDEMCVCVRAWVRACVFRRGWEAGGEEKGKISQRKQSQWGMKEASLSPALGRGRRTSSFTVTTTPGGKDRKWQPWRGVVVVYAGWWKNSQAVTGFHLFIWSGSCCCWLRKHLTAQDSNALPQCSSRH